MKNMRITGALTLFLAVMLAMTTGCTGTGTSTAEEGTSEQAGGEAMSDREYEMSITDLTEAEKKILSDTFGEEKRFEEGRLFSYQIEALEQLRAGRSYLEERYPGHAFKTESFTPADRFHPWAELRFKDEDSPICLVKVFPSQDGETFECEDNFYGYLIQESYDNRIEEILREAGCPARSSTVFLSTVGSDLSANPSVEELLFYDPELSRQTALFVSDPEPDEETVGIMQKALLVNKMYGNYWVYFTGQEMTGGIKDLEASKSQWESLTFSCFEDE